jgi:hypothetical protein
MESFEIYNGRVPYTEFHDVIMNRYRALEPDSKHLFECSFFQNSMEDMMLYYQMSEQDIVEFYREAYGILKPKGFIMWREAPVAAQVLAILPVFCGISGSKSTRFNLFIIHSEG